MEYFEGGKEENSSKGSNKTIAIVGIISLVLGWGGFAGIIYSIQTNVKTAYVFRSNLGNKENVMNSVCSEGLLLLSRDMCDTAIHGDSCETFDKEELMSGINAKFEVLNSFILGNGCKVVVRENYRNKTWLRSFKIKLINDVSYPMNYAWDSKTPLQELFTTNQEKQRYSL
jgi:hypothetical protein